MTASTDILESIDGRLRQLDEEIRALQAARAALDVQVTESARRTVVSTNGRHRTAPAPKSTRKPAPDKPAPAASAPETPTSEAAPASATTAAATSAAARTAAATTAAATTAAATTAEATTAETTLAEPAPTAPKRAAAKRRKRAAEVVPAGKLEVLLAATDGMTTSALAERSGGDRDQVLTLLRELETAGRVRRSGERRSTKWHAITDEDRIAQRAAELAAQSRVHKSNDNGAGEAG
jgi:ABC-2 type transport system ATP-binding protein